MVQKIALLVAFGFVFIFVAGCDNRPRPFSEWFGTAGCHYKDGVYAHGATTCQDGTQYRCEDGQWKGSGGGCSENAAANPRSCDLGGSTYSAGTTSCQAGARYRCDDGVWKSLAVACPDGAGDAAPTGRTCLYNGATVATGSSICKSGVTFRCDDGEWRNLGTTCR